MPSRDDLTDALIALIALIPENGSRISKGEIKAALEQELGEPLSDAEVEDAKTLVVEMGAAEKARGPGGDLGKAAMEKSLWEAAGASRSAHPAWTTPTTSGSSSSTPR